MKPPASNYDFILKPLAKSDSSSLACAGGWARRDFLKIGALAAGGIVLTRLPIMAGPFEPADFEKLVPADKKLAPDWVKSLFARGERTVYRWPGSEKIGMPIGGICCGQLYLGGDGKLWHWDIFNRVVGTGAEHYASPMQPTSPLDQGFALRLSSTDDPAHPQPQIRALDHTGWRAIEFNGEYPIGRVDYRDPDAPATVALEAFSPFIPLQTGDSALPATIMRFTVTNHSRHALLAELAGWLENAVCLDSAGSHAGLRRNRIVRQPGFTFLDCAAEPLPQTARVAQRPDRVFEDFERAEYQDWTVSGTAFGSGPVAQDQMPDYQGKVGAQGRRLVNSHASAPGKTVEEKDSATGELLSKVFVLERDYITFLIGGGSHAGRTCMNLLAEGRAVLSATGHNENRLAPHTWDVRPWAGRPARLQIVDSAKGSWGNVGIDHIVFTDTPGTPARPLDREPDFGTMGLALLADRANENGSPDFAITALPDRAVPAGLFSAQAAGADGPVAQPFTQKLTGALTRKLRLQPGQAGTVTFVIAWHFPNVKLGGLGDYQGRHYGQRFANALAVAEYVAAHYERLAGQTRLWHDTWYDSTLPYWFLDRTLATASHLATNTCYWFGNGRFYGWEGVGCCAGTCTHVWHYAHTVSRLFPQLERSAREIADYGAGFDPDSGRIRFRAEHNNHWAVDGQAGCILRVWREHQTSADDAFLRRIWPRVKRSMQFLIGKDEGRDGLIDGPQHNTLDADWWGRVAWLSGLYLAALRAGEEMAREMGDAEFARECRDIFERGRQAIDTRLFNGEYYVQLADPRRPKVVGSYDGCEIDQVFGDSWAWQVGLGRILDQTKVRTALGSLWRYNFTPDVGPYRNVYKPGRWYAMAGEGGLLMCTWPKGEAQRVKESFDYYFNECMTGFEYQVAGHMLAERMLLEGLAIVRAIHDRYHAARRNPWNEVECGDHYARAMAGYGVFLAACGFEYHGPKGHLGFSPRLNPEQFQCAFTAAEGWGTFAQRLAPGRARYEIRIQWGKLRIRSLAVMAPPEVKPGTLKASRGRQAISATLNLEGDRAIIRLEPVELSAGENLAFVLAPG